MNATGVLFNSTINIILFLQYNATFGNLPHSLSKSALFQHKLARISLFYEGNRRFYSTE